MIWWQFPRNTPSVRGPQTSQMASPEPPGKQGAFFGVILNGGGSTFLNPLMQHWAVACNREGETGTQSKGTGQYGCYLPGGG